MNASLTLLLVVSISAFNCLDASPTVRAQLIKVFYGTDNFYVIVPNLSETVGTVKQLIEKHIKVPAADQVLTFLNEELANGQPLSAYGVGSKTSPVLFVTKGEEQISEPRVTMLRIFQGKESYFISTAEGIYTTIGHVKDTISKRTGIKREDVVLEFAGIQLTQDTSTLDDYNIDDKTAPVVFVSRPRFDGDDGVAVKVYFGNQFFTVNAGNEENIGSFKEAIRATLSKANSISISFNNSEIDDDEGSLSETGIFDTQNPVLHAALKRGETEVEGVVLTIHHGEKRFQIITSAYEKIVQMKKNIERITGVPSLEQTLSFHHDEMQNELTMNDYGITSSQYYYVVYLSKDA